MVLRVEKTTLPAGSELCAAPGAVSQSDSRGLKPTVQLPDQGFSLLELVIVIVIMSLALAVTYPSLNRGSASIHLRAAGRECLNTLRYAREKAITEQRITVVLADRARQKFALTDEFGEGARYLALPQDVKLQRLTVAGQEVMEGPLMIRFLPNGSCEEVEIELRSDKGGALWIVTDPIIGGARILTNERQAVP